MATIHRLVPGQIVYQITRQAMGNTTVRRNVLYTIKIIEIDLDHGRVLISWNGNRPEWRTQRHVKAWRVRNPEPKGELCGLPTY